MAEVKVKITAQNEVRTGLQQALQETQKFGQEAKRAVSGGMTINPFAQDDRLGPLRELRDQARALREQAMAPIEPATIAPSGGEELATTSARGASAIRGLAADLANATSAADVFQAVISRISTAFGGLIAASAGFAIGSIIRRTLEDAAAGIEGLIDQSQSLQQSFSSLSAPTTTFDQLASSIRGASAQIEALEEANRKLQSGIGFQVADYINAFDLSTAANRETEQGTSNARAALAAAIGEATNRELQLAKARTEEERKLIALQSSRDELLAKAMRADPPSAQSGPRGGRKTSEQRLQELFAAQDGREAQDREREFAAQAAKQRAINEDNRRSLEERLAREKQGLADLEQFGGAGIDLQRERTIARIAELEKQIATERERAASKSEREAQQREQAIKRDASNLQQLARSIQSPEERRASLEDEQAALAERAASLAPDDFAGRADVAAEAQRIAGELRGLGQEGATGSFGASSLQRIGFASNEFFDTRSKKDPAEETKRAADFVKQIIEILKKGEPLVLPASS